MARMRQIRAEISEHDSVHRYTVDVGVDVFSGRARPWCMSGVVHKHGFQVRVAVGTCCLCYRFMASSWSRPSATSIRHAGNEEGPFPTRSPVESARSPTAHSEYTRKVENGLSSSKGALIGKNFAFPGL